MFISIEGIDGVGKTSQVKLVSEQLTKKGYNVFTTYEPGGSRYGKQIRQILSNKDLAPQSEIFLLMADRFEHYFKIIKPKLDDGYIVITDRYIDSTFAYQGYGYDIDTSWIESFINAYEIPLTDKTFWIDLPVAEVASRLAERMSDSKMGDADFGLLSKYEDLKYLKSVNEGYNAIYKNHLNRIMRLDGNKSRQQLCEEIVAKIIDLL